MVMEALAASDGDTFGDLLWGESLSGGGPLGALVEALSGGTRGDGVLPMRGATVFVRGRTQCRRGRHWIGFINPVFAHRLKMVLA